MAFSIQRAVSDGTMTLLPVSIEYFDRSEIQVAFDDVVSSTGWSWVGATDKTIAFSPAVPIGVEVSVIRTTDLSELRHQYALGAQFTAESMDESFKQVLHIAQEATERQLGGDFFTDVDMHGYQIQNLGPATAPDHAVTLQQYQADANGASAAKDIAVAAAASASSSASVTSASATSAAASASAASASASSASASESAAAVSASSASTSASAATTKAAEAVVSASSAAASAAAASVSETNAAASAAAALHPWVGEGGGIHYDSGNVRVGGVGARITGDFSNDTIANRLMFQTTSADNYTAVGALPNGSGANAHYMAFSTADPANCSFAMLSANHSNDTRLSSDKTGAGTYLPMTFYTGGSERMRIAVSGAFGLGGANYGTAGQVLTSGGAGVAPSWTSPAAVPTGAVAHFAMSTAPSGWLKANGALVSRTTYAALFAAIGTTYGAGDGSTTFNLPDLRGEFLRGLDDGRGVDAGRGIGTWQGDDVKSHAHNIGKQTSGSTTGGPYVHNANMGTLNESTYSTLPAGGSETRPRNIAMLACIKF